MDREATGLTMASHNILQLIASLKMDVKSRMRHVVAAA